MKITEIKNKLTDKGLKVTPQRIAILEAITELHNHPTAENIIDFIRENHPNIATGTVYKVLDTFLEKELVKKVKTEKDIMRYDAIIENHHHLYCKESDRIEDYFDSELNQLIEDYLKNKSIKNFEVDEFRLQITGKFTNKN